MAQQMRVRGIALATRVFHLVGLDDAGHGVRRKRLARSAWLHFRATLPPALIGMEAGGHAHDWARCCRAHGYAVRLIAPPCVNPSGKSPTHEAREAEAIWEAVTRPTRRVVPINQVELPDLQALPRVRA